MTPPISRIRPMTDRGTPPMLSATAQRRIAPSAMRKMDVPIPMVCQCLRARLGFGQRSPPVSRARTPTAPAGALGVAGRRTRAAAATGRDTLRAGGLLAGQRTPRLEHAPGDPVDGALG